MASVAEVFFDFVTSAEAQAAADLEKQAFPPDEADSPEMFRYRYNYARHLFLGAFVPSHSTSGHPNGRKLIGHICATQSPLSYYTRESMFVHVPCSPSICVHSICILETYQKKGIGLKLIQEFLSRIQRDLTMGDMLTMGIPKRVLLITHGDVRHFYEKVGFTCGGKSNVVLGAGLWYEMVFGLDTTTQ